MQNTYGSYHPGMKVAKQASSYRPDLMMLGTVAPDGAHVIWSAMVDHEGHSAPGMGFDKQPRALTGDERACPAEFTHLIG
jgi:hypothetical protein